MEIILGHLEFIYVAFQIFTKLSRDIKDILKSQTELLEIKLQCLKWKKIYWIGTNGRVHIAEENISECEYISRETI